MRNLLTLFLQFFLEIVFRNNIMVLLLSLLIVFPAPLTSVTPAMVQERGGAHDLEVLGVGFMGQYHPINSTNLREKLDME